MIRIFKFYAIIAVIILCTSIVFTTSSYADNLKIGSSGQTRRLVKTKAKSKVRMSDSIIGSWGGKHISMEITGKGANVEYDCAHGTINQKIIPDKNNRFDVSGTQVEEHGGPIRENDAPNSYPVRFIGQVKGKRMTLIVKRKDNNKIIGTFSLVHGQESFLVKCL